MYYFIEVDSEQFYVQDYKVQTEYRLILYVVFRWDCWFGPKKGYKYPRRGADALIL